MLHKMLKIAGKQLETPELQPNLKVQLDLCYTLKLSEHFRKDIVIPQQ